MPRLAQNPNILRCVCNFPHTVKSFLIGTFSTICCTNCSAIPKSEEGGKYIGYIDFAEHNRSKDHHYRVIITDFLPGGPNATRTAVEFLPDGEFQEQLYRRAEKRDANVEHLGTWHSHHCNGLDRLSGGDIEGYFRTVNKAAYRPEVFVASLVKHLPKGPGMPIGLITSCSFAVTIASIRLRIT